MVLDSVWTTMMTRAFSNQPNFSKINPSSTENGLLVLFYFPNAMTIFLHHHK